MPRAAYKYSVRIRTEDLAPPFPVALRSLVHLVTPKTHNCGSQKMSIPPIPALHYGGKPMPSTPEGCQYLQFSAQHGPGIVSDGHRGHIIKFDHERNKSIPVFKYQRLSSTKQKIRLLKLMAGNRDTPDVECQLLEAQIENGRAWRVNEQIGKPKLLVVESYEALSWSWGNEPAEYQILLRKDETRTRMKATSTLVWALKYLRWPDRDRTLWIDAICINQQDVDEKNHQVQMMSQIYNYAASVCVWLGLDDAQSHKAIQFIQDEILQLQHFDKLCEDEANSQKWQSLLLLMQRPWFFRRWVVQEIALAQDAMIYCGPDTISWKDFSVAVELFVEVETATHRLSEVMKKDPKFYHVPGWFEYVSALGASCLVEATGMVFRYYKEEGDQLGEDEDGKKKKNNKKPPPPSFHISDGGCGDVEEEEAECGVAASESEAMDGKRRGSDAFLLLLHYSHAAFRLWRSYIKRSDAATHVQQKVEDSGPDDINKSAANGDSISKRRPLLALEHLVSRLSIFEASEPRDAIYALLAIAKDAYPQARADNLLIQHKIAQVEQRQPFLVDYGRAYTHVCRDFIEFCVKMTPDKSRALDIICRPWAPDAHSSGSIYFHPKPKAAGMEDWLKRIRSQKHPPGWKNDLKRYFPRLKNEAEGTHEPMKLPTWIPRLAGAPFSMFYQAGVDVTKVGRANADPLVGDPLIRRNYDAAQGMVVDEKILAFKSRRLYGGQSMFVKGFILDTVRTVAASSQSGNIPANWLEVGEWDLTQKRGGAIHRGDKDTDGIPEPPEAFWRTLVADRGKDGQNPPYYYARACKESVAKGGVASGSVSTADLINNERNSVVSQFCRRVQAVIWNRCLIKTKQGNLGIANKHVRSNDYVAILYGCSVPVILRRKKKLPKQIEEEDIEDEKTKKVEKCSEYIKIGLALRRRKANWEKLPETVTEEQKKEKKWGKSDVRKWRQSYLELEKKMGKGKKTSVQDSSTSQAALPPKGYFFRFFYLLVSLFSFLFSLLRWRNRNLTLDDSKKDQPLEQKEFYYELLGECYSHGMMDGEAVQAQSVWKESKQSDEGRFMDMVFELR